MILGLNLQMILTRTLLSITEVLQLNYNSRNTHSEIFSNRAIVKNLAKFPGKHHEVFSKFQVCKRTKWKVFCQIFQNNFVRHFFSLLHLQLHGPKSHSSVSTRTPVQSAPLFSGFGLVQVRIRTLVPKPQVTLHGEYSDHTLQPPFTKC